MEDLPQADSRSTKTLPVPCRRTVVLGASNVAMGLPIILAAGERRWGAPLEAFVACGHGRSYALTTRVFVRTLEGISDCGLWEELASRPQIPTAAVITDIGNDLFYNAEPESIAAWVEQCLQRLAGARIAITGLPLFSTEISPAFYYLLRTVMFPSCRRSYADICQMCVELNAAVVSLARQYGASLATPQREWYGFDPIHIRPSSRYAAWDSIFALAAGESTGKSSVESTSANGMSANGDSADHSPGELARKATEIRRQIRGVRPARRWWFGREQFREQPAACLASGTRLSLY